MYLDNRINIGTEARKWAAGRNTRGLTVIEVKPFLLPIAYVNVVAQCLRREPLTAIEKYLLFEFANDEHDVRAIALRLGVSEQSVLKCASLLDGKGLISSAEVFEITPEGEKALADDARRVKESKKVKMCINQLTGAVIEQIRIPRDKSPVGDELERIPIDDHYVQRPEFIEKLRRRIGKNFELVDVDSYGVDENVALCHEITYSEPPHASLQSRRFCGQDEIVASEDSLVETYEESAHPGVFDSASHLEEAKRVLRKICKEIGWADEEDEGATQGRSLFSERSIKTKSGIEAIDHVLRLFVPDDGRLLMFDGHSGDRQVKKFEVLRQVQTYKGNLEIFRQDKYGQEVTVISTTEAIIVTFWDALAFLSNGAPRGPRRVPEIVFVKTSDGINHLEEKLPPPPPTPITERIVAELRAKVAAERERARRLM